VATKRVSKSPQQERAGGEGTGYRGDNTCQKKSETRHNLDPGYFFVNRFWGRRPDGVAIIEALKIVYILEFKRPTDRDEGFLEVKDAEANEQNKSIIGALKAAAPEWEFEQINFVVGNRGSVVGSDFYTKLKKLEVQEGEKGFRVTSKIQALRRSCDTGMRSAQSGDCVLPPAGVRRFEANYRGIEAEDWAQFARVRR